MAVIFSRILIKLFSTLILFLCVFSTALAATYTVTKITDTNDGTCNADCSLREAIAAANATATNDDITFDAAVFGSAQTISLTISQLQISNNGTLAINGTGMNLLTVRRESGSNRIFLINAGATVSITGVTIRNGITDTNGGGISNLGALNLTNSSVIGNFATGEGGGIFNAGDGTLNINNSVIFGNQTNPGVGGGIYNQSGTVTINNSSVGSNSGGGIYNNTSCTTTITNSSINNNSGGGIRNVSSAIVNLNGSTVTGNSAQLGGGISNSGSLTVVNSTITLNIANTAGGGIFNNGGLVNLTNVTVNENSTGAFGGGVYTQGAFNSRNSIFADNKDFNDLPTDFHGTLASQGYNLIENTSNTSITGVLTGNITGIDPKLGALIDNQGVTFTCALLLGSPAIDAGDPNNVQATDQRGVTRPRDGDGNGSQRADIGAFERVFSGKPPYDFDADGKTDLSIFKPGPGQWWYLLSGSGQNAAASFGTNSDKLTPADFTGDGKTDCAFWRPSTGFWFILRSEDSSFFAFPFGTTGDIPAPGDFDGDSIADTAVFRPSTATWYIRNSTGGVTTRQFGANGDAPVVADYDGDSKSDIAIYRPSVGQWWINRSSDGTTYAFQFGSSTDKPVQGDYTGDGKADAAFWRPSNGFWFVLRSEDFSFFSFPFGSTGDIPAPGDYDGDAMFDATVFRPSSLLWFVQRTSAGTLIQTYGETGDIPVPSAYIP